MSQTLGTILLALKADTSSFVKGLSDAKSFAFDSSGSIVQSLKGIGEQLTKLNFDSTKNSLKSLENMGGIVAGIGAGIATAVVAVAESTAQQAKELDKLSQSYGVSIEQVSAFRVASKLTGVDLETLTAGFGRLARGAAQVAATGTGPAAIAFQALGIQVTDSSGRLRPMSELMGDVAQKFSTMENGTSKTALAMQLFGKSGAALIPFLNQGREGLKEMQLLSDQIGLTWSEKDVQAAKKFAEQTEILEFKSQAFGEQVAKGVMPALDQLANTFVTVDSRGGSLAHDLGEGIGTAFLAIAEAALASARSVSQFWLELQTMYNWATEHPLSAAKGFIAGLASPLTPGAGAAAIAGDMATQKVSDSTAYLLQQSKELDQIYAEIGNRLVTVQKVFDRINGNGAAPVLENISAWNKMVDELNKLSDRSTKLTDTVLGGKSAAQDDALNGLIRDLQAFKAEHPEAIWADINRYIDRANKALRTYQERQQAALQRLNAESEQKGLQGVLGIPVATARASGEAQAGSALINLAKDVNAQNQAAAQIYDQTRTSTEAYAQEVDRLNILLRAGSIDHDTYNRALQQAYDRYSEIYDPLAKYREELQHINDALKAGSLTQQQENSLLKQRADLLRQMQVIDAQQKAQGGGARAGISAGLATFGAQWQGIGLESMRATINVLQSMQNAFSNFFQSIFTGTQSVGQAFLKLGTDILGSITSALAELLAKWIVTHIAMKLISTTSGISEAASYAAVGAAAAGASVAAIPFVGWAMAPAVMAEQYAMGMMYAGLASAAGGMVVDRDQLAMVHKNEHILPANIADLYRSNAPGRQEIAGHTFQIHFSPTVQAFDSDGVDQVLTRHRVTFSRHVESIVRSALRNNRPFKK